MKTTVTTASLPAHSCDMAQPCDACVREQLLKQLHALSFHAFEQCVRTLLLSLGYGEVRLLGRTQLRQFTRHGGLDMLAISQAGVTDLRVALQAKQYNRPVSRRFIDELRGVVLRTGATHGLIVTTSTFSHVARTVAGDPTLPIRLVDGEELLDLLFQEHIGVHQKRPGTPSERWSIDETYFTNLMARFPASVQTRPAVANLPVQTSGLPDSCSIAEVSEVPITQQKGGEMLWRTHVMAGIGSLWLMEAIPGGITNQSLLPLVALAAFGSLLPDLDAAESKIKSLSLGSIKPFAPFAVAAHRTWGHRGMLHSPVSLLALAVVLSCAAFWWSWQPSCALWLGYASHLAMDACTRSGIPLSPGDKRRIYLLPTRLRFVTGSLAEEALLPLLAVTVLLLVFRHLIHP